MNALAIMVALMAAQRLAELAWARRNERRLRARGAIEHGRGHYAAIVLLHLFWIASLPVAAPRTAPHWPLLGAFLALQPLRLWTIAALGPYWSTRVLTIPGAPLVRRGPYRWLRHPNYAIVAAEIALLPAAFGAWGLALGFSVANALLLHHRIRVEEAALAGRA